ncbi:MAG: SDR family oxidoreductase [Acidobacteriota bacterium]|nr:SDR family oxidoreductase [Acidobacteriota bacterium]
MKTTGNTILITGGGSGIGRGLAEAFHKLGNKVIIAGRRKKTLDETTVANPGMASMELDIENVDAIRTFATRIAKAYPSLNVLINNAGIMRLENVLEQQNNLADAESIIATNLLGPIRLTLALLPVLQTQPAATIINVSSGLAFVPMSVTPTYCATKAAIHSYTQSPRYQLKSTRIEVLEIIPPYVQTDLLGGAKDPNAMPLDQYIAETMRIFTGQPNEKEICVERVKPLRFAAESGHYDATFKGFNDAIAETHTALRKEAS